MTDTLLLRLDVAVKAMDLRFLTCPIMVGTYEQDPIAGPQALIDRELLDGDLSQRHALGLYAGPVGTVTVVLRVPKLQQRQRAALTGAVVTGLGSYDGALIASDLTDAVRAGVLRYLLQVVDVLGKAVREVPLATLLLGYNSSASLAVAASVEALVRGVLEANAKFRETTRLNIRVASLNLIELYQDTAISAVYALREMPARLNGVARRAGTLLVCRPELECGEGMRPRLFDGGTQSYWPRLIITDADGDNERRGRAVLAERLRFLYVGQRPRAESVVQQRQPGLIEALVRQQIDDTAWNEDIGRTLLQLLLPHDFKDTARQVERVVLVVDAATANLPWELMLADAPGGEGDNLPMAVRTAVVRQLASTRFRRRVRQGIERTALVVGNPSVEGFGAAFPDPRHPEGLDPPALPGAEAEAAAVATALVGLDYRVTQALGADRRASEVLALLYSASYRIVHIAAHGVFDLLHRDGLRRSGVVLSDGMLITAAEIAAMETVPELVVLSCCHLGQIDAPPHGATVRDGNKLAASLAGELIEIGVRCVVAAGWAVDDQQAQLFGETFYRSLLQQHLPFGDAVHQARRAVWERKPDDITWGAFQAYGDPGWRAELRDPGARAGTNAEPFASPEELLDVLASVRADLSRRRLTERETRAQVQAIRHLLSARCPPEWRALPLLQSALGAAWRDLGRYEDARIAYLNAVQAHDGTGRVPIKDIEDLAGVKERLGELQDDERLIRRGRERLRQLDALVSSDDIASAKKAPRRRGRSPGSCVRHRLGQPWVVVQGPVGLLQLLRDRAEFTRASPAHGHAVEVADGDHAAASAAQEDLVGRAERGHRQRPDAHRQRGGLRHLDHRAARDAFEHAGLGRDECPARHREDVEARPLGHVARRIDEQRSFASALVGLEQRLHHVEPMVVLDPRIDARRTDALHVADDEIDAAALLVGVGDPDERDREGHEVVSAAARVARARRGLAARTQHLDVGIAQARAAHAFMGDRAHLVARLAGVQAQSLQAGEEALEVVAEAEELALPHVRHVVGGVGMQESPVEDRDLRVLGGDVLSVDVGATLHDRGSNGRCATVCAGPRSKPLKPVDSLRGARSPTPVQAWRTPRRPRSRSPHTSTTGHRPCRW